ncbi:tetratricopeptide repeat protein [Catenulispora subtropica]|uniref:Tetratricopeptide repeat protein n=1 Tax=Catenulispora subtropica TaxID=450798 RepID=A0ABN2SEP6_9ACTN
MASHTRVIGAVPADRRRAAVAAADDGPAGAVVALCHRNRRGPYTGVDTVLRAVLPDAADRWPDLVEQHRVELLYGMPELEDLIGPAPRTLASEAPFMERTRFYGSSMIRCMSQGVVSFLVEYATALHAAGKAMPVLVFDEIEAAEATTQEFVALLIRRADPDVLRVVASGSGGPLPAELEAMLDARAVTVTAGPPRSAAATGSPAHATEAELVEAFVAGDGTSEDPEEIRAYQQADPGVVAALHDRRADELASKATWSTRIGALAYHREHGSDPAGAGRLALLDAQRCGVAAGFSALVVDLGHRGRAVTDPVRDEHDFWEFTYQAAAACVPLNLLDESLELYLDLLRRYSTPKVHMTCHYSIAMLYTRFFQPRDHEAAVRWQNTAIAIAGLLPDPGEELTFSVFQANGMALIQMHRGNLAGALELVEGGIARLDAHLAPDQWVLHRSQLLYNRARLLVAMGRSDEAFEDYTTLIGLDPYYTDYLSERARIFRMRGDFAAALADYDRAVELAPPYPELFYNRGTARQEAGDLDGALADFDFVLAMEPDDIDTRLTRADVRLGRGDLDAAEADVEAGLALRPGDPRLLCMRGTILLQRELLDEAVAALDAALAADPKYPAALVNRAVAAYQQDRFEAAVADLTATLAIVGEDPDVLLNRGIAHRAAGRPALALADFDRALTLPDADLDELRRERGRTLVEAGDR